MKVKTSLPRGRSILPISERKEMGRGHLGEVEMAVEPKMGHCTYYRVVKEGLPFSG
jgi:hypothetical protein